MTETQTTGTPGTDSAQRPALLMTGLGGLLFLISIFFEGPAELDEGSSADEIRNHYEDSLGAIELQVFGALLGALGLILLTVGLVRILRSAGAGITADLALVSGALTSVWLWLQSAVDLVPVVAADDDGSLAWMDDSAVHSLDLVERIGETFGDGATVPRALLVLAASAVVIATRVLPIWFGYVGVLVGLAGLVGIAGTAFGGPLSVAWFVGLFGFLLWTLVLVIVCLIRFVRSR